jgi:hypothetical protein
VLPVNVVLVVSPRDREGYNESHAVGSPPVRSPYEGTSESASREERYADGAASQFRERIIDRAILE